MNSISNNHISKEKPPTNAFNLKPKPTHLSEQFFNAAFYAQRTLPIDGGPFDGNYRSFTAEQTQQTKRLKAQRRVDADPLSEGFTGPWGRYDGDPSPAKESAPIAQRPAHEPYQREKSQARYPEEMDPYFSAKADEKPLPPEMNATARFHLSAVPEYQVAGFIDRVAIPRNKPQKFHLPKQPAGIYKGHTKAVIAARFIPNSGAFFLSASFDATLRLWESAGKRRCVQTYLGHGEAVKDFCWTNDGEHFLSAGFDRRLRFWDTERGVAITTCASTHIPCCVRLNPDPDRQHLFLCATMGRRVEQWDLRSGRAEVKYEAHMDPVNNVVFTDGNRKFISFGDDRKAVLWEFGVPLVVRSIEDPDLPAVTQTELHPSTDYVLAQTALNKLCVFDVRNSALRFTKKKFGGHSTAGFSVAPSLSPNGKFVASGDQEGRIFFWDWKTSGVLKVVEAHEQVCAGVCWLATKPSTLLSYSWDGTLRLWE